MRQPEDGVVITYLEAALVIVAPAFLIIGVGSVIEWFMERRDRG